MNPTRKVPPVGGRQLLKKKLQAFGLAFNALAK
jgi:hypothetical protein